MSKNCAIIYHNPLRVLIAVVVVGLLSGFFLYIFSHTVGNGLDLNLGVACSNNKACGSGIFEIGEVDVDYVVSFLFLDTLDNALNKFCCFCHFVWIKTIELQR